ncbi:MAG: poly(R)-hydroxyalkanoic acid synthase subunit PhaE, partial [Armatimonadota bacterium]|nr:poly(R)-hydroxyalkanoic acid synthase subunit PhaE [Armatimonadota bacterium]
MSGSQPGAEPRGVAPSGEPEPWQALQKAWLDAWAKAMHETVAAEEFAQVMGRSLEVFLQAWAPLRQMERVLQRSLEGAGLPTRADVLALAERLDGLARQVEALAGRVDALRGRSGRAAPPSGRGQRGGR